MFRQVFEPAYCKSGFPFTSKKPSFSPYSRDHLGCLSGDDECIPLPVLTGSQRLEHFRRRLSYFGVSTQFHGGRQC